MFLRKYRRRFSLWLLKEDKQQGETKHHQTHSWWQVMCLTGVDYFSTLGYQPGIAALAAGALSPIATLILILLTLFGALPIYRRVASLSPKGEGSIAMLENLMSWWQGKLLVLFLLGFVATDFIITITLSAADATAHIVENPLIPQFLHHQNLSLTLILIALLGAVFLKGFEDAIAIAVLLVVTYLSLNLVVISVGIHEILKAPAIITAWQASLFQAHGNPLIMIGIAALLFPKLALGLSGFETGVAVMPLVKGSLSDTEEVPRGRIHHTHNLLTAAAVTMSFFLFLSSLVTTLLIKPEEFQPGGAANGRALAYLSHHYLGNTFGTIYDLSTISILWFAGASAMAGLLNVVPRYLPRYGMAPDWARKRKPLVLVYLTISFVVTILFNADVDAQGGAYATGVLVLMSSAAYAVTLSVRNRSGRTSNKKGVIAFGLITAVFIYTTIANIIERPDGVKIALFFIGAIVATSLISRVWRSTELRVDRVEWDDTAKRFISDENQPTVRLIAHRPNIGNEAEYIAKEKEVRLDNHLSLAEPILFLEVKIADASDFIETVYVSGVQIGNCRILRAQGPAVPNAIAAILLQIRNRTKKLPHAYFGWAEGNPVQYLLRFLLFGEGDTAIVTREVLRRAESDPELRPGIHVGG